MELFAVCNKIVDLDDDTVFYGVYVPGISGAIGTGETVEEAIDEVESKLPELLDHIVQYRQDLIVYRREKVESSIFEKDQDHIHFSILLNQESTFESVVCLKVTHDAFETYENLKFSESVT